MKIIRGFVHVEPRKTPKRKRKETRSPSYSFIELIPGVYILSGALHCKTKSKRGFDKVAFDIRRKNHLEKLNEIVDRLHALQEYMKTEFFFNQSRTCKEKYYDRQIDLINEVRRLAKEAEDQGFNFDYREVIR